ncbi:MAG: hypothetical protein AVDCRST_MAG73-1889, partial [uncultured Thermomicrobiales bacterium]
VVSILDRRRPVRRRPADHLRGLAPGRRRRRRRVGGEPRAVGDRPRTAWCRRRICAAGNADPGDHHHYRRDARRHTRLLRPGAFYGAPGADLPNRRRGLCPSVVARADFSGVRTWRRRRRGAHPGGDARGLGHDRDRRPDRGLAPDARPLL